MVDILISSHTLSEQKCIDLVEDNAAGGTAVFIGTVRNQTKGKPVVRPDFEAFVPMTEKEMRKIANQITDKWGALHVVIHHRVGSLSPGEVPVIISVSTPHRKAAFEACQYAIDTLKETVPIWKKEIFEDGEVWVASHP